MNRRDSLKALVASGGLIALPSWANGWSIEDVLMSHSSLKFSEQDALASLADAIIPPGDAIGALSVGVDKFLQKIFADCYTSEVQVNIAKQLVALDNEAQHVYGKPFVNCDRSQRLEQFTKRGVSTNKEEKDFFNQVKAETIRGFNTSREVMVTYLKYKVAPGHYFGCVDVTF